MTRRRPLPRCGARRRGADRARPGRRDRHDRRRRGAAPRAHRRGNPRARAGIARFRQGQAPRLVRRLSAERRARGAAARKTSARPTRSSPRSTSGASCIAFEPVVETVSRKAGLLRMPDAHPPRRRRTGAGERRDPDRRTARSRAPDRPSRDRAGDRRVDRGADAASRASTCRRIRRSIRTGGPRSARSCARAPGVAQRLDHRDHRDRRDPGYRRDRGFVTRAKDLGCRIAIDDFGAGYTSFRNLRPLGVDIIKIDGAFVQNLTALGRRPRVRAHADRARPLARPEDRRRMGAGRGGRRDARRAGAATTCRAR